MIQSIAPYCASKLLITSPEKKRVSNATHTLSNTVAIALPAIQWNQRLIKKAKEGKEEEVRIILKKRWVTNDNDLGLALQTAARNNHSCIIKAFLRSPQFEAIPVRHFARTFQMLAGNGDLENINAFMKMKQIHKMVIPQAGESLKRAAKQGHSSIVNVLGQELINLRFAEDAITYWLAQALLEAIENKHTDTAQIIIHFSLFKNIRIKYLGMALSWAARYGLTRIVTALMNCHVKIENEWMDDALEEAIQRGRTKTAEVIKKGNEFWVL